MQFFCTFWVYLRMLDHLYYYSEERVRIAVSWLTGLPAVRLIQNQGNSAIAWSITMRIMTIMKVKSQRSTKFWITTRFSLLYCEKKSLKKSSIWSNLGSSKEENTGDQGCMWLFWVFWHKLCTHFSQPSSYTSPSPSKRTSPCCPLKRVSISAPYRR